MHFATKAIRVGQAPDNATRAVVVPIHQSVNFAFDEIGKHSGYEYTRSGNPTRAALEECLAALEEARFGLTFGSGSAATDAVLSVLRAGDHVVAGDHLYGGTLRIFESLYKPRGVTFSFVDGADAANFGRAMTDRTKLVWIESPTNPLLGLVDISAVAEICRGRKVPLVVDNTFATPYFQQPLTLGAEVVVHSTTKYIGGHSDVLGGAVLTSNPELYKAIHFYQNAAGAVPGPLDCWLALRGVKTLAVRMRQHAQNALRIAEHLTSHPVVKKVYYPGLPSHPQHELARRQMSGFGGVATFEIEGGREAANAFVKHLRVFLFAESLGGVESLVCHPATMSHASISQKERDRIGVTDGILRLSVGIEDERDLIEDLDAALDAACPR
jgi:cystathionine beta-lyase/cystathionine gamma-synthase